MPRLRLWELSMDSDSCSKGSLARLQKHGEGKSIIVPTLEGGPEGERPSA